MDNVRDRLKVACAFIEAGPKIGTGYLIAPDLVATCHHVVDSVAAGAPVRVAFHYPDLVLSATVAGSAPATDCAILKLESAVGDRRPLLPAQGLEYRAPWETYGYPQVAEKDGIYFAGVVESPDGRKNGEPAVVLYSEKIAAGMATPVHGLSGSPVLVGGALVGHIASVRPDAEFPGRPAFGEVFASPVAGLLALLKELGRPVAPAACVATPSPPPPAPALGAASYHAFVSYRSTDRAFAMDLVERLEARGFKVYIDQRELLPGDELVAALQSGIASSQAALALISAKWLESPWCRQEASTLLHAAVEQGKRLIPIRLDECELPPMLASKVWIDLVGKKRPDDETLERIIAGLTGRPVPPPAPTVAAERPAPSSSGPAADGWSRIEQGGQGRSDALLTTAQGLISVGEPRAALSLLESAGDGTRARQLRALALSKSGRHDEAIQELEPLSASGQLDAETGGILGGRYKEQWLRTTLTAYLSKSFRVYRAAWERSGDLYPGVNALAVALYLEKDAPAQLSDRDRQAVAAMEKEVDSRSANITEADPDNWRLATRGEALLLVHRDLDGARRFYALAVAAKPEAHQEIAVMRRQARRNLKYLGLDEHALDAAMPMPGVVAFVGHMTDAPGRPSVRFPKERVGEVRKAIRAILASHQVCYGFSSLARGSDILFAEEVLERGGRVKAFLPFPAEAFKKTSVETTGDERWSVRFDQLLTRAATKNRVTVDVLRADVPPEEDRPRAYAACNLAIQNAAIAHAKLLDDERPMLLAVWDGKPGDGCGGTADAIRDWRDRDQGEVETISPIG